MAYIEFMQACDGCEQLDAGKDYGKRRTKYPDFAMTDTGLQYQDLREGSGRIVEKGDRVTVDWDGYTIGGCSIGSVLRVYALDGAKVLACCAGIKTQRESAVGSSHGVLECEPAVHCAIRR